ncbi:MAG TPA: hypothetical protein VHN37_12315 [Actinomycetota bacterium]|nr:hypothetical protein [Actinomycetota bacterium]
MDELERKLRELGERTAAQPTYAEAPRDRIVRRARLRRGVVLGAPALAVVVLAALVYPTLARGGRDGDGAPVDLATVVQATEDAETARIDIEFWMELDGRESTVHAEGTIDFARNVSHLRMEQTGTGSMSGEMIAIGDTMYQRTGDSKWYRTEVGGNAVAFGASGGPGDILEYLESQASDLVLVGREELDGVPVTHYRATLDADALGLGSGQEVAVDPMEVWIDDRGLARKTRFASTLSGLGGGASMEMTTRLWDFGVEVDVQAPDPDDVTDKPPIVPGESETVYESSVDTHEGGVPSSPSLVGPSGWDEPYLEIIQTDRGEALVCLDVPAATGAKGASRVVDERSGKAIASWAPGLLTGKGEVNACSMDLLEHAEADLLMSEPARFTLRVGTGPDRVEVELAELRGAIME